MHFRKKASAAAMTGALLALPAASSANAGVTISSDPTSNISCSGIGVCTPTANNSVLNASQLETILASGNATINTLAGAGAGDITVAHAITWASWGTLTLNSNANITITKPISVSGSGGVALNAQSAQDILFGPHGHIAFLSLAPSFSVNAQAYTLVDNIATLANDILERPQANFALAHNVDAAPDGIYTLPPIPTLFSGTFNGLGNTISHLTAKLSAPQTFGLFQELYFSGLILDLKLDKVVISGDGATTNAGGLVGTNAGTLAYDTVNAKIANVGWAGGIAAINYSLVENSYSEGKIDTITISQARAGGLVGVNGSLGVPDGTLDTDYSTVSVVVGKNSDGGGLVGYNAGGPIGNSYATGSVTGGKRSYVGGLIGYTTQATDNQIIEDSYSTGTVAVSAGGVAGGFVGYVGANSNITGAYWDMTTSGINSPSQGAGTPANAPGITGQSTTQLQSELPAGFSDTIWGESAGINGGLPYLIALPPK